MKHRIAGTVCLSLATLLSSPAAPASGQISGRFGVAVQNDRLISTEDGRPLQLLGTSVSGLEQGNTSFANTTEDYGDPIDPGFAAMASWNMNVVRIPLNEHTWLGINNCIKDHGSAALLQSNLHKSVEAANAVGMYVILDLHWTAPNTFGCPQGQGSMPDADNTVAFWKSVAASFKGNPAVLFELFNEPFGTNEPAAWLQHVSARPPAGQTAPELGMLRDGGSYQAGFMYQCNDGCKLTVGHEYLAPDTAPFRATGMQSLVDAIRSTGAVNVILANPIGWAGQIQTWLESKPHDPAAQLVAGWHEDGGWKVTVSDAQGVLGSGYPIIITEAYTVGDATFNWSVNNGVGFLYWAWVDWGGGGLLTSARSHAPAAIGAALKNSFCHRPTVNRLAQCGR
jgi:endoglucanase